MKEFKRAIILVSILAVISTLGLIGLVKAATTTVNLGVAESFAVLAGTGITNGGISTITGDVGSYPTTSQTGFGACPAINCVNLDGTNHAGDSVTQNAKSNLITAYNNITGRTPTQTFLAGDNQLGGQVLTDGVYAFGHATTANIIGTLTLDGQGDPDSVFIFQASSDLVTASTSTVSFINGAQACNVFWQVTSSATLGTSSTFGGTIIALTSATLDTNATVEGRVLARNGTVTLLANTITRPECAAEGELSASGGSTITKQTVPWSMVLLSLAGVSTIATVYRVVRRKQTLN